MTRKSIIYPLMFIILTYIMFSCRQGQSNNHLVKIGINEWIGYSPFVLADEAGIFSKNKAHVELVNFASGQNAISALRKGEINGATLTLDEVVVLVDAGYPIKVVLVIDFSMGGDMVLGQSGITAMEQLKGKRVGYEGSVVGEFMLHQALNQNGLKKASFELVDIPAEDWVESFQSQKVDALVCFNPMATKLINESQGNVLFHSGEIPYQIIDVLAFSEPFYNSHKPAIKKVMQSWFDALAFQKKDSLQAKEIISREKNISPDDYTLAMQGLEAPGLDHNLSLFRPESEQNIYKYAQPVINFMQAAGLISERINTANLFSNEVLESMTNDNNNEENE